MRIVLTGGPSAGKTTIAEALVRVYFDRLKLVPEGASILFRGGFPRETSDQSIICQQRAIFHVQRELEELKALDQSVRSSICDRGTLDGLAYWPGTDDEFFANVKSNREIELARYDWVLHLETTNSISYQTSTIRQESFARARELNEKVKHAWRDHPQRIVISNNRDFSRKLSETFSIVKMILEGASLNSILQSIHD